MKIQRNVSPFSLHFLIFLVNWSLEVILLPLGVVEPRPVAQLVQTNVQSLYNYWGKSLSAVELINFYNLHETVLPEFQISESSQIRN